MIQLLNEKDELAVMASKCLSLIETVGLPRKERKIKSYFCGKKEEFGFKYIRMDKTTGQA